VEEVGLFPAKGYSGTPFFSEGEKYIDVLGNFKHL
jgi:hypothetical protein